MASGVFSSLPQRFSHATRGIVLVSSLPMFVCAHAHSIINYYSYTHKHGTPSQSNNNMNASTIRTILYYTNPDGVFYFATRSFPFVSLRGDRFSWIGKRKARGILCLHIGSAMLVYRYVHNTRLIRNMSGGNGKNEGGESAAG